MFDIAAETVLLLGFAAFFAGFIDAIAGGGGLVTVPALLLAGMSPVEALGTNKLQGLFGSGSSAAAFAAKGHVDLKAQMPWAAVSFIASIGGALLATVLPGELLEAALPVLLIAIALYFAFKPRLDDVDRAERMRPFLFGLTMTSGGTTSPITVGIATLVQPQEIRFGPMAAVGVVTAVPIVLLVIVASRQIVAGLTRGALKG
jgi:uncharacterized protein